MRKLVESKVDLYQAAVFKNKARLAWEVVNEFKACGGRFLKEEPSGLYLEVDDETSRKKVSIAFRDAVKRAKQQIQREEQLLNEKKPEDKVSFGSKKDNTTDRTEPNDAERSVPGSEAFELFPAQNLESDSAALNVSNHHPAKRQKGCCFSGM